MRPLRYSINITLDGCCDHRAMLADAELHRHAVENLAQADALLFGRVTYEMMEAAWRPAARTGARPDWMEPFARTIDDLLEATSNETGVFETGLPGTRCLVGAITRRCRGRRPGRTRCTGSCSNDRSQRVDARRRARSPPIHRWRTSSRHPALHTSRTSAPPSVPSPDHPFWISRPKAGGELIDANPPPVPVQLLRAATMPRRDTSAPITKITTAR